MREALATPFAFARFGLGPRAGALAAAGADAQGFFEAELAQATSAAMAPDPTLPDGQAAMQAARELKSALEAARASTPPAAMAGAPAMGGRPEPDILTRILYAEIAARLRHATQSPLTQGGYVERLAWFWSNHFAVSTLKNSTLLGIAGVYEREAIRPHVLGKFEDMLIAVETHPAMLMFLDNIASIGPNSPAGRNRNRGLNENLGREILELHTMGVGSGYTQADVTNLARIITGWTIAGPDGRSGTPGLFTFNANWHEPGAFPLLGQTFAGGYESGVAALRVLARRPETAKHIALKLARHFVADNPPPALVDRLAKTFLDTRGDLRAVSLALLRAPEAWSAPRAKIRTPQEFLVAALRLPGARAGEMTPVRYVVTSKLLGQQIWAPAGPNGFSDRLDDWASPEGLKARLDVAARLSAHVETDPAELVETAFGAALSNETAQALKGAESRQQASAILLMSPEFQRR